ncbi:MAG: cation:proton antiporter, partial [Clostridia bacterium]|nr:cation:proton antiporter [Clostridia bacterium]
MFELANYIKLNTFTDLALMIFTGMAMGRLVKKVKLPNVTGYLVAGLILGPSILGVLSADFLSAISVISDCALGFIAFSIGNEFKISFFKRVGVTPIIIAILESFFAVVVVAGVLIPVTANLRFSLVLASIAAATAPAATIMVIKQYRAKGPVTETLLSVVALDDATALIMYSIATAVAGAIAGKSSSAAELALAPAKEIFGAIIVGAILGFIFLLPLKFFKKDSNRTALEVGFIFLGLGVSQLFGFSSLLLCMALGAIVANFSSDVGKL